MGKRTQMSRKLRYDQTILGIPLSTNCSPPVADLFYTATKEISSILLTMAIKLINNNMLSRLLIRIPGTSMTFKHWQTFLLKVRSIKFIHLNYG